jgi:hypothetical protein
MVFAVRGWHVINQGLRSSPKDILATLGSLVSIGTVLAAAVAQIKVA